MMVEWMEARAQLGIKVKLTTGYPSVCAKKVFFLHICSIC